MGDATIKGEQLQLFHGSENVLILSEIIISVKNNNIRFLKCIFVDFYSFEYVQTVMELEA